MGGVGAWLCSRLWARAPVGPRVPTSTPMTTAATITAPAVVIATGLSHARDRLPPDSSAPTARLLARFTANPHPQPGASLLSEAQRGLGARSDRVPDALYQIVRNFVHEDVEVVVVVDLEDLRNQACADGVGLAGVVVGNHLHRRLTSCRLQP